MLLFLLLSFVIYVLVNIEQALRVAANFYLKHYRSELKLAVNTLEIDTIRLDVIKLSDVSLSQGKNDIRLSNLELIIDASKPYWLSQLVLEKGQLAFDIDSLSQLAPAKVQQGGQNSLAFYRGVLSVLSRLPDVHIKAFSGEIFSGKKSLSDKLQLTDSYLSIKEKPKLGIKLAINQQNLVAIDADFQEEAIHGQFSGSLGKLNTLAQRYFDFPLMITGKLSSDFILTPAATWSLSANNKIANSRLDLMPLTGQVSTLFLEGDVELDYQNGVFKVQPGPSAGLKLVAAPETSNELIKAIKQQGTGQVLEPFLLDNIPEQLQLLSGSTFTLDISKAELSGQLSLLGLIKKGKLAMKLSHFTFSEQGYSASWQLDYHQQAPFPMLEKLALTAAGEVTKLSSQAAVAINNAALTLTGLQYQGQDMAQGQFTLTGPGLFELANNQLMLSDNVAFVSDLRQLQLQGQAFDKLYAEHQVRHVADSYQLDSSWQLDDSFNFTSEHLLDSNKLVGTVRQENASLSKLLARIALPELLSLDGQISNEVNYQFALDTRILKAGVKGQLLGGYGNYDDIIFDDFSASWSCAWQTQQLDCEQLNLTGGQVDAGIAITELTSDGQLAWQRDTWSFQLAQFNGRLLNGSFTLSDLDIMPGQALSGNLELEHISLIELVALQQQPGIEVTGYLDGKLPFSYDNQGLSITSGTLLNQGNGVIRVDGNPAVEQLKQSQPDLKFALDALKELHYKHLGSEVSMSPDGATEIKMSMQGSNPDISRPIHFNYLHQENLLQLLRSLRIDSRLSDDIEQALSKP